MHTLQIVYTKPYMTKNPFVNGSLAALYIITLVSLMTWGTKLMGPKDGPLAPVAVISLLTLSAAVMAYIFCYQPIQLYFDNKKKQAVNLFLHTTAVFAGFTFIVLVLMFFRVLG